LTGGLHLCRCLIPRRSLGSPPRGTSVLPPLNETTRAPTIIRFRGSITRPQSSLSTLRSSPRDVPRKTRLQLVANLSLRGIVYPQGCLEVSSTYMAFLFSRLRLAQFVYERPLLARADTSFVYERPLLARADTSFVYERPLLARADTSFACERLCQGLLRNGHSATRRREVRQSAAGTALGPPTPR